MKHEGHSLTSEALSYEKCLSLLDGTDIARVVLSVGALPAALPTRIALVSDHLVISSREIAVLLASRRGDVVSVQIDGVNVRGATWSVMVSGILTNASPDEVQTERIRALTDKGAALFALPLSVVSGQREV